MARDIDINGVDAVLEGSGPEGLLREGDDFHETTKKTIGDYLSCLTKEGNNRFVLKEGSKKSTLDTFSQPQNGAKESFAPNDHHLNGISDSGLVFKPSVSDFVEKGKDGHDTLRKISGNTNKNGSNTAPLPKGKIQRAVSSVLTNNRFNPSGESPYVSEGEAPDVVAVEQNQLGVYNPKGKDITFEQLSKVSKSMAIKAVGNFLEGDPDDFVSGVGSLIPGEAQLGATKLSSQDMYAENAFGAPSKSRLEGDLKENKGMGSWGQLNNYAEPFDGFAPLSMLALSGILIVSLRIVAASLVSLLSLVVSPNSEKNSIPPRGPFILGEFGRPDLNGPFTLKSIGIQPTERDFLSAVDKGIDIFLRFDFQSPGYYVTIIRSIIRGGNLIVNDVKDAFSFRNRNPLEIAQSVVGIVDTLKGSKVISFLNVMAQIGDKALEVESQGFESGDKEISTIDKLVDNAATRVMKSRRGDMKLSWQNSGPPSKYLFPSTIQKLDKMMNGITDAKALGAIAGLNGRASNSDEIKNNRIDPLVVQKLEDELDAEYVPFYFHDLRTNEIVSFPAFLTALDDNYSANYNSSEPYGRVDPIQIYKNTVRTLTVGFKAVATNKEDFDEMWWKINHLSSYMYPQWSQGQQVLSRNVEGNKKFIQPFSQIPKASPLIRIRIGDVIKSNYSKFNLARIFGFGTDKNDIAIIEDDLSELQDLKKKIEAEKIRMSTDPSNEPSGHTGRSGYRSGDVAMLMPKIHKGYVEATFASGKAGIIARGIIGRISNGRIGNLESRRLRITAATRVRIVKSPSDDRGLLVNYGGKPITYYTVEVINPGGDEQQGNWLVTHQDLYPDLKSLATAVRGGIPDEEIDSLDDRLDIISEFMSDSENSIVKSFNSTRGRGLAGVINTLSFPEMNASVWETTEHGSRAPKIIQVNLTFSVIHDISPGLDNEGFNRAPIYPVGQVSKLISGDAYDFDGSEKFEFDHAKASTSIGKGV